MKALQVKAEWKPREGYQPNEREQKDKRYLLKVGGEAVCGSDTMF